MSDRGTGRAPGRVVAVLGPTNTGKTHLAVERMLGHGSGMIGLPLRLLAREIYERIVVRAGKASVALVTGEEKISPPHARFHVCTVEAMPMERSVDFLAVDEIQLVADPERGHVFTNRLLHARGRQETMFLGAGTMEPLIRRLVEDVEIQSRDRLSTLAYVGPKKLTRLPRRSAVVAFSAEQVYAIAELIRRQRGGAAIVMGALSPRTRNAQVELFQSGEVDFLVATDAIGMGLNMDVDHVAFAGLRKFDGTRTRWLHAHEIGQIAGRAGRHLRDGTFGVTGEAEDLDEDLIEQVVEHRFDPVEGAEWRNGRLDFDSLPDLLRSLTEPPRRAGLRLTSQALDETLLRRAVQDEDVQRIARSRGSLMRLWDACQVPDFQKTTADEHFKLTMELFHALIGPTGRLSEDWIAKRFRGLDHEDGQIDQLSARLAGMRTLSYVAARPDWLENAPHWRERTRALEDRLSDALHARLTARFVDRKTTALMRALHAEDEAAVQVDADGAVRIEGAELGRIEGLRFVADRDAGAHPSQRRLATRAVEPEVARRLGRLAADGDDAFAVLPDGSVTWDGQLVARVTNEDPWSPRVRLIGDQGVEAARERARRRIEAWLAQEAGRALRGLSRLKRALESGALKGLTRGLAFRLVEAGGVLARREVDGELAALSQVERRTLKTFGVRVGAHSVWLPTDQKTRGRAFAQAFWAREGADATGPRWASSRGLRAVAGRTLPLETLERMAELRAAGQGRLDEAALGELGLTEKQAADLFKALKTPRPTTADKAVKAVAASPFAALAGLTAPAAPPRKRRPRRKARPA